MKKKIFITGGAGYVGARLVNELLKKKYVITVYDIMYFGDHFLPKNNSDLTIIQGDIRDQKKLRDSCKNHDYFVHLACISNDTSFALDEKLSTTINLDAFKPMVKIAKENGIKRFIYASSSSVYGVSDKKNVTEDHPLVPLTLYNKFKGMCEPQLLEETDNNFHGVVFRPATVCGYSPRQRLDLSVNILTNFAVNKKFIKVFGGDQLRPNLHIADYCEAVFLLISAEENKIKNEIFNVGYQNLSIMQIAEKVKKVVEKEFSDISDVKIVREKSDDIRSYHINSDKIKDILNFTPKYSIEDAILELCDAFKKKLLTNTFNDDFYFNVKRLQNIQAN
jgi:nucleoside-diphosphate-sugar epimerase